MPERRFIRMLAQPIIPWTPGRMMQAAWVWLMAENPARGAVKISKG